MTYRRRDKPPLNFCSSVLTSRDAVPPYILSQQVPQRSQQGHKHGGKAGDRGIRGDGSNQREALDRARERGEASGCPTYLNGYDMVLHIGQVIEGIDTRPTTRPTHTHVIARPQAPNLLILAVP